MSRSVEEIIQQAMREGAFDNLPGTGKPLNLDDHPNEDPSWAMAHHLLRSQGFSLPWIETLKEIEADLETARKKLAATWKRREADPSPRWEAEWKAAQADFQTQAAALNRRIFDYNLQAPRPAFHRLPIDAGRELAEVTRS